MDSMIRKFLGLLLLTLVSAAAAAAQTAAQPGPQPSPQPQPAPPRTHLKVGDTAPDFTLMDTQRNQVKLSDFRGKKNVVLAFYVLAFTGG
jgi:cytochrome oxidase Cu insertion factor (SCO1/SenC/PrrC family)